MNLERMYDRAWYRIRSDIESHRKILDRVAQTAFQARFSSAPDVRLHRIDYDVGREFHRLKFTATVTLDYGTILATAKEVRNLKIPGNREFTPAELNRYVLNLVEQNCTECISSLLQRLPPQCTLDRSGQCSSQAFQEIHVKEQLRSAEGLPLWEFVRTTAAEWIPAMESEVLAAVNRSLEERRASFGPVPGWASPCTLETCALLPDLDSSCALTLRCTLNLRTFHTWTETLSFSGPNILADATSLKTEDLILLLKKEYGQLAAEVANRVQERLISFEVIPPEEDGPEDGFPLTLWQLLRGEAVSGRFHIQLNSAQTALAPPRPLYGKPETPAPTLLAWTEPDVFLFAELPLTSGPRSSGLSLGILDRSEETGALPDQPSFRTIWETLRFLTEESRRYEQTDFGDLKHPEITFTIRGTVPDHVAYAGQGEQIPEAELPDLRRWLDGLYTRVLKRTWELVHEPELQMEILSRQNPTVLAILQFICQRGRPWAWQIKDGLSDLLTAPSSIPDYLDDVRVLTVPIHGKQEYVVEAFYERTYSGRKMYYYKLTDRQLKKRILAAKPGPYQLDDIPNFTPEGRLQWLQILAKQADTPEKQWNLLEFLGAEKMTRTSIVAFLRSDTGAAFLRGLDGSNREYARLLLEDVPGCKRLVNQILAET